ncbi:MAG: hypothetical protein ACMUIP_13890 [bacterium]
MSIEKRFSMRIICLILCFMLIIPSALHIYKVKNNYDGPRYLKILEGLISEKNKDKNDEQKLIILNTTQRRFLFPFVHVIKNPVNIGIFNEDIKTGLAGLKNIEKYSTIFIMSLVVPYQKKPRVTEQDINLIVNYFSRRNFHKPEILLNWQSYHLQKQ